MITNWLNKWHLVFLFGSLLAGLLACGGGGGGTNQGGTGTGPGMLNPTLMVHVGGNQPTACTISQSIPWTASSTAGSTQTKTSPPVTNGTSQCDQLSSIESNVPIISCSCPVQVSFTGLAAGNWTVQADSAPSCAGKVNAGATSTMTIFTDGRACTTFP